MSRQAVPGIVAAVVVLATLNLVMFPGSRELREVGTSLGHGIAGEAAVFDLLTELGFAVERTYEPPSKLPSEAVLWLIDPRPQRRLTGDAPPVFDELLPFVERGGTAVVFGSADTDWATLDLSTHVAEETDTLHLARGPRDAPDPSPLRTLALEHPRVFDAALWEPGTPRVRLHDPDTGSVFAVEIARGSGRIIAVSDGRFLENSRIAEADAAVLAVDLARAHGAPLFDERFHGLRMIPTFWEVAGVGRVGLALLALVALAWTAARLREPWPPRRLDEPRRPEVTLHAFVDALSGHYARTRDWAGAFAAYRDGALHRLRRRAERTRTESSAMLTARLALEPGLAAPIRDCLVRGRTPSGERAVLETALAIERFVEERA